MQFFNFRSSNSKQLQIQFNHTNIFQNNTINYFLLYKNISKFTYFNKLLIVFDTS